MLTSVNLDKITFFNFISKNRRAKKIHNLAERLAYSISKFPGNDNYRQRNFFEIRYYYNVFMNLKLYRNEG